MDWEPLHAVRLNGATATFMGLDGPSEDVANVDVEVVVDADGSRWSATFLTLDEVARLMARWSETGEFLGGRIFPFGQDMVILRSAGLPFMVEVLEALVHSGEFREVLVRLDPDDDA